MPELPEVETTRRGIAPHLCGRTVTGIVIRERRLRWPISPELEHALPGGVITTVQRRAKYLLIATDRGTAILHLGMSGSLRVLQTGTPARKHDHVDIALAGGTCLRLTDPRRFGALLWTEEPPETHMLLRDLGPEPLGEALTGDYLYAASRGRRVPVKSFIMDGRVVVGVGNIYASEALFMAGISPKRASSRISRDRYRVLVATIREVLEQAIKEGGTTLRDYFGSQGEAGYFRQFLRVYGRTAMPCLQCGIPIRVRRIGQRSTFYCPGCQR